MWRNTSIGVLLCITVQDHIFNCKLLYSPVLKHVWMEDPQFVAWYSFLINPIATNDLFHIDFSISLGQDTPTWISQSCSKGGTGSFIQPSATVPLNMHKISWHLPNVQHNGYYWIHQTRPLGAPFPIHWKMPWSLTSATSLKPWHFDTDWKPSWIWKDAMFELMAPYLCTSDTSGFTAFHDVRKLPACTCCTTTVFARSLPSKLTSVLFLSKRVRWSHWRSYE